MTDVRSSNSIKNYPVWKTLSDIELLTMDSDFKTFLINNVESFGIDIEKLIWNRKLLFYIFEMIKKRELYFHIFHNGLQMGEVNEICLYVFWILKLRPFTYINNPDIDTNFIFAMKLFTNVIYMNLLKNGKQLDINRVLTISNIHSISHAFQSEDLSKEAIMLLAHSLIGDY